MPHRVLAPPPSGAWSPLAALAASPQAAGPCSGLLTGLCDLDRGRRACVCGSLPSAGLGDPPRPEGLTAKASRDRRRAGRVPRRVLCLTGQHVPGPGAPQVHSEEHWSPEASPHAPPRGTGQNPLACPSSRAPEPERRAGSAQGTHRGHRSAVPHDPSRGGVPCRAVAPGTAAAGGDSLSLPRRPLPVLMRPPPWLGNPETHSP